MAESETAVYCGKCGVALDESSDAAPEDRIPCSRCGSSARKFDQIVREEVSVGCNLEYVQKRPGFKSGGRKRPVVEGQTGHYWSVRLREFVFKTRTVDRVEKWYSERVVRKNGDVLRDVEEPIQNHRRHGSDKFPKKGE